MVKGNYLQELQALGLSLNEARLYETLLRQGEISVAALAKIIGISHRNVHDSLLRLLEKGLALEIIQSKENVYQAIDPNKIGEIVDEQQAELDSAMKELQSLCSLPDSEEQVTVYRGEEGWKRHLLDVLHIGQPFYILGGKPFWNRTSTAKILPWFSAQIADQEVHLLLDSVAASSQNFAPPKPFNRSYKFLPKKHATACAVHLCGDRTTFISYGQNRSTIDPFFTMVRSAPLAESFRCWFKLIWEAIR